MGIAYGYECPECGGPDSEVLQYILDENKYLEGFVLRCKRCEHVFVEYRD